jgi:hypothetical protein
MGETKPKQILAKSHEYRHSSVRTTKCPYPDDAV